MHTHLGQPWNRRGKLSAEMLLRWMDAHKIAQAVVLPLISPESWFYIAEKDLGTGREISENERSS